MSDAFIEIELTPFEMLLAAQVGARRQIENLVKLRRDRNGAPKDKGWQFHIDGALGELVVAKWKGVYWNGSLGNLNAADVGDHQVRSTPRPDGSLMLHKSDADDEAFILATGPPPLYVLRGWVWAREGKLPEYWRDPVGGRPAFFVPQGALRPMATLE